MEENVKKIKRLGNREKNILIFLGAVVVVLCAYFFGFRNLSDSNDKLDKEISELNKELDVLKKMYEKSDEYDNDKSVYLKKFTEGLGLFDTGYSQEYAIMFLKDIEETVDCWINQGSFAETELIYEFGKIASSNPNDTDGKNAYDSDYVGYKTKLTLNYQAPYQSFLDMVEYINHYKYKCTIDTISASYNAEADSVSGRMDVTMYCITGSDREFKNVTLSGILEGTDNIFYSSIFKPGVEMDKKNGDDIITVNDYSLTLGKPTDKDGTIVFGKSKDVSGGATLKSNANDEVELQIRFFQDEDNNYRVQYALGDETFPNTEFEAGEAMIMGDRVAMLVISSERESDSDKIVARTTIINDTDKDVDIKVLSDDKANPKFVLEKSSGKVKVYK